MELELLSEIPLFPLPRIGATAPKEIRLFKFGENETLKGPVYLTQESAKATMEAYRKDGHVLTLDLEHSTFDSNVAPENRIAVGHFRLALRADGLYAVDIQWVPGWDKEIEAGKWVFVSPAILHDKNRAILKVQNVALTNLPATQGIDPLLLSQAAEAGQVNQNLLSKTKPIQTLHQSISDCITDAEALLAGVSTPAQEVAKRVMGTLPPFLTELSEILEQIDPQGETMPTNDEQLSAKTEIFEFCKELTGETDVTQIKAVLLSNKSTLSQIEKEILQLKSDSVQSLVELAASQGVIPEGEKPIYLKQDLQTVKATIERRQNSPSFAILKEKSVKIETLNAQNAPKTPEDSEDSRFSEWSKRIHEAASK